MRRASPLVEHATHDHALGESLWNIRYVLTRYSLEYSIYPLSQELGSPSLQRNDRAPKIVDIKIRHITFWVLALYIIMVTPGVQDFIPLITALLRHRSEEHTSELQ